MRAAVTKKIIVGGSRFWFWPLFQHFFGVKISITAIAVIEILWAHGRGKFRSKRGSRFCDQIPGTFEKEEKQKNKKTVRRREMVNPTGEVMGVPAL